MKIGTDIKQSPYSKTMFHNLPDNNRTFSRASGNRHLNNSREK
jgi:hypothetical protein